ncbi:TetR/AcrR family transcriptional regulator [Burkholderia gladioli]|uniref:TetR/AcrR family transcriptional regulator n=1 Tax=Burkholderia gladioli TaxID=28095 RepID=UPI0016413F8C|nr:TetR/AcrR family transcriptional regulator [Burkholderia gladioli]
MGRRREFDEDEALEAALLVFWQKGYEGASFDDLTQATGVARPGLYAAFGNKEALFLKALDLYETRYLGFMSAALDAASSREVVERILHGCARLHTMSHAHTGCLGLNGALACSDDAASIQHELNRRRNASQAALRKRLERAQREGDLPASADCATLAAYVAAVTQGMAVQAKAGASRKTLEALAAHVLDGWPGSS